MQRGQRNSGTGQLAVIATVARLLLLVATMTGGAAWAQDQGWQYTKRILPFDDQGNTMRLERAVAVSPDGWELRLMCPTSDLNGVRLGFKIPGQDRFGVRLEFSVTKGFRAQRLDVPMLKRTPLEGLQMDAPRFFLDAIKDAERLAVRTDFDRTWRQFPVEGLGTALEQMTCNT